MKTIGVVICNYNKKDFVVECVKSLKKQTVTDFDIYVVDNASIDGSAEFLSSMFGKEIMLICNEENLGGSGGFNSGIREVMGKSYEYVMLLDNDVVLAEDCVEKSIEIMRTHPDIGMLGCEILKMDYPDRIQEFGPTINYNIMNFELNHGGEIDKGQLPEIADCDYVPACAMVVRREVVEKIGLMPQENFIYYDDITWGVRCRRANYRVAVTSLAKAWHKGGAAINPTTFSNYYLSRNKTSFFMKYMQTVCDDTEITDEQIEKRAEDILRDTFEGIYACNKKGVPNVSKSRMEAFLDALWGVTGKAEPYKIRQKGLPDVKVEQFLQDKEKIHIHMNGLWENTRRILNWFYELETRFEKKFVVSISDEKEYVGEEILGILIESESQNDKQCDAEFYMCPHIYEIEINEFDKMWIDGWRNAILDDEDFRSQQGFRPSYELFKLCFKELLVSTIRKNLQMEI